MKWVNYIFKIIAKKHKAIIDSAHIVWWFFVIFWPWSIIFSCIAKIRNFLYDKGFFHIYYLPGQVISIGNIELGGTGKSPFVIYLALLLKNHGKKPIVLTRGYKSGLSKKEFVLLQNGKIILYYNGYNFFNFCNKKLLLDEPRLQSYKLQDIPVLVGIQRARCALKLLRYGFDLPSHWILDDGFQHRSIKRDLDIVLLSAQYPFSNAWVFPLGYLREPLSSLKRSDVIVLSKCDLNSEYFVQNLNLVKRRFNDKKIYKSFIEYENFIAVNALARDRCVTKDMSLALITAIAKPEFLINYLQYKGYNITKIITKLDHDKIEKYDISIVNLINVQGIITTEKDFYRDEDIFITSELPVWLIPIQIYLSEDDKNDFEKLILSLN